MKSSTFARQEHPFRVTANSLGQASLLVMAFAASDFPPFDLNIGLLSFFAVSIAFLAYAVNKRIAARLGTHLPGPRLLKYTKLPFLVQEYLLGGGSYLTRLHKTYGPIVQVGPKHVSLNSVACVRDVFAVSNRLDRPYPLVMFHNYGVENLVSTMNGILHIERRKPIRTTYSGRHTESDELTKVIAGAAQGLVKLAMEYTSAENAVETRPWLILGLYDILSFFVFGARNKTNLLQEPTQRALIGPDVAFLERRLTSLYAAFMFLFPGLTLQLRKLGLAPPVATAAIPKYLFADSIGKHALSSLKESGRLDESECLLRRLYLHYRENGPSPAVPSEEYILSDCLDHFWAGVSTTTDSLEPLFHFLSEPANRSRQLRLREEIQAAAEEAGIKVPELTSRQLKELPFLNAVICETLRLHPPVPFNLERRVPEKEGRIAIQGHAIPAGWTISARTIAMAKDPVVFDMSETWVPERWLASPDTGKATAGQLPEARARDMRRHFLPFGAGPRMCIGVNLAWSIMRGIVAGVYGCAQTEIASGVEGKQLNVGLLMAGKGKNSLKIQGL